MADVLLNNQPLSGEQIARAYDRFLTEKGLQDGERVEVPPLEDIDSPAQQEQRLELVRLANVAGVNALAADQTIEFDPAITIFFGENGTGKTGYARILKRLAAVRTAEEILPDINAPGGSAIPSADVVFKVDGTEQTLAWQNEAGVAPFTRMSVFDAPCVTIHVDSELNYVYTPAELALFVHVVDGIRGVQGLVEQEVSELRPRTNPFLARFTRGSQVYPLIETLGSSSELAQLQALGAVSEDELARREVLETEVAALRGSALGAMRTAAVDSSKRLERILALLEQAAVFEASEYAASREAYVAALQDRQRARNGLFIDDDTAPAPDDAWQTFVTQAEDYRTHLGLHEYPQAGDRCLYCRQELDSDAAALIRRYQSFLADALAKRVADTERAARSRALRPAGSPLDVVLNDVEAVATQDVPPPYAPELLTIARLIADTVELTGSLAPLVDDTLTGRSKELLAVVRRDKQAADDAAASLAEQIANGTEALRVRQAELLELDARITLNQLLPSVRDFVDRAKRADRLGQLAKSLSNTVIKRLTELSKLASEDLVNKNFEQLFEEERQALRAPQVALEFQGRRGKAERKKAVARHKPSSVLSEGEQKVLALADFLAEGRMGSANAPIIFDDPVTSLDYRRMGEVASRISLLAESHQVVVFTHNIMFASSILALRTSKKIRCTFYEVRDDGSRKGLVQPAAEPRSDTPPDFESRINQLLQTARSADPVVREALLGAAYGLLRSWCEAFVEQELLRGVSQRYRVNVMMSNLNKIRADRLQETIAKLLPIFDRCSRFMPGHSQPVEQLNVQPSLPEFETDFEAAKALRKAYIAKP